MRISTWLVVIMTNTLAAAAPAADLNLEAVLLSSGGVGYFQYAAQITGDAELSLPVRLDQVDDVLKSIVVYDSNGGVGTIRLPGRSPLAQRFRDLPFDADAMDSAVRLLQSLRGETVTITGPARLEGRLLSITAENTELPDRGGRITRHRIALLTAEGLQQVLLEDVDALQFANATLQTQVDQALRDVAAFRAKDTRTLLIQSLGNDDHTPHQLQVGYVTAAPLWKTSYRLALDPAQDNALLQGWAHLENMSGQDWTRVRLTLSSGNPVTFRQDLYQAYYVDRPEVPVEVLGRVMPRTDQGALEEAAETNVASAPPPPSVSYQRLAKETRAMARPMVAMAASAEYADELMAAPAPQMAAPARAAVSEEVAEQVMFTLPEPVTVANGYSLMAPIANRSLPAKRLALYQPDTHPTYPMDSVRLINDGDTALPPGVVTFYAHGSNSGNAYLGDARLDVLPAGDSRLLSFALDRNIRIHSDTDYKRTISKGRIVNGVFHLVREEQRRTDYRIKSLEQRRLWIEHPLDSDWKLMEPDPNRIVERTASHYRIEVPLEEGTETTLTVLEQRPLEETIHLSSLRRHQARAYANSRSLSPALRKAFSHLVQLQGQVEQAERNIKRLETRIASVGKDQDRIRRNMDSLDRNSDLYRRYMAKLDAQETILEGVNKSVEQQRRALDRAREALEQFIRNLKI